MDHPLRGPDACGDADTIRGELLDALPNLVCDARQPLRADRGEEDDELGRVLLERLLRRND